MRINVVCRNWQADRILPRFARYLRDGLGWTLTAAPDPAGADVLYLMGYFETQVAPDWEKRPVASLFTHREEDPRVAAKTRLFDHVAARVDLRVSMCRLYGRILEQYGPVLQPPLPVELDRFVPAPRVRPRVPVVGVAGWTYSSGRKGCQVLTQALRERSCPNVEWRSTGSGWAITRSARLTWAQMPAWYQGLDVLVCPSLVEGGPMPPLEALACGVPVVIPVGVGVLDELPPHPGIIRYARGDAADLARALSDAVSRPAPDPESVRAIVAGNSVDAWCAAHAQGFERVFAGKERAA